MNKNEEKQDSIFWK